MAFLALPETRGRVVKFMLKYARGMTDYNWGQSLLTVPGLQHYTDLLISAVTDELVFLSVTGYSAYAASLRTRQNAYATG